MKRYATFPPGLTVAQQDAMLAATGLARDPILPAASQGSARLLGAHEPAAPATAHRVDRGLLHAFFSVLFWRSYAETLNRLEAEGVLW